MNEAEFRYELANCRNVARSIGDTARTLSEDCADDVAVVSATDDIRMFLSDLLANLEHLEAAATGVVQRQADAAESSTPEVVYCGPQCGPDGCDEDGCHATPVDSDGPG